MYVYIYIYIIVKYIRNCVSSCIYVSTYGFTSVIIFAYDLVVCIYIQKFQIIVI